MRWIVLSLYLALAAAAVATALATAGDRGARANVVSADGAFDLSSSADGEPIFTASGIGPGDSTSGTVAIGVSGGEAADLSLSQHDLADAPGAGGGLLSAQLTLRVRELGPDPSTVYAGPLATMPAQGLGRIEPGEQRRFEFVASLPDAGTAVAQNAVQGATTSVAFSWTASEPTEDPQGGGPNPTPPVAPTNRLALAVTKIRHRVKHGRVVIWARCDRACAISVRGRFRARSGRAHRVAPARLPGRAFRAGPQRLRIRLAPRLRHWLRQRPGPARLRGRVVFSARDQAGASVQVKRKLRLRIGR